MHSDAAAQRRAKEDSKRRGIYYRQYKIYCDIMEFAFFYFKFMHTLQLVRRPHTRHMPHHLHPTAASPESTDNTKSGGRHAAPEDDGDGCGQHLQQQHSI